MIELLREGLVAPMPGGLADARWLLGLAPLLALAAWRALRRRPRALPWPALAEARAAGASRLDLVRAASLLLRGGCVLALALVLAVPLAEERVVEGRHEGLDLVLVVDASASMRALDAEVGGQWRTRLELAREVVARFARARVAAGDRVGLVVFGDTAFTACPLTSDGALLETALERVTPGIAGEATALGDALALAVRRVTGPEPTPGIEGGGPRAGRLVVLLTDGRTNAGRVPPDVAAGLAVHERIRVHTVGIGTRGEVAMAHPSRRDALRFERHDLDAASLERIAEASGGRFFRARGSGDLAAVYAEIDALERIPRPTPPRTAGRESPEPLLAVAGALLLLEIALARVAWRRLP